MTTIPYYTIAEAMRELGYTSRSSVYYRIDDGRLATVETKGGTTLIAKESVDALRE